MERDDPVLVRIARIVAISGVTAGVAGGVVGRIVSRRRTADSPATALKARSSQGAQDVRERLRTAAASNTGRTLRESLNSMSDAAGLDLERLKMRKPRNRDTGELADRLRASLTDGREKAGGVAAAAIHDAADYLSEVAEDSKDASGRARSVLVQQRDDAPKHARRLKKEYGERFGDLEEYVTEALDERVKPSLARAGKSATHVADELGSRLSEQLDQLGDVAEDRRPQVAAAADNVSQRISRLLKDADARSDDWRGAAERALQDAEGVIQANARGAKEVAGDVGGSAKQGSKDFGALVFWVVVAGGLIYAFLMDDEQKRKSRELAQSTFHEGKELYRDVRGRDADFDAQ